MAETELVYLHIHKPSRNNVREPIAPPEMRLARPSGRVVTVKLNEAQLLAIINDAVHTLDKVRQGRNATQPTYLHWIGTDGACTGCGQIEPSEGSECPYAKQGPEGAEGETA